MTSNEAPPGAVPRVLAAGDEDLLIREEPLLIKVAGEQLLTMRTPGDDGDLAIGFLLSEGVIGSAADVAEVVLEPGDQRALRADTVRVELKSSVALRTVGRLTRTHEVRPSCGVCGLTDPDQLLEELPPILPGVPRLERAALELVRTRFTQLQPCFHATGACHGAALFGADGVPWSHGEDVGRHNALDKAIGKAARDGRDLTRAVAMLSGRAGFDLVMKCLRLRVPIILSVSAATALSFDLCSAAGATLVGFVREQRAKVYCDGGRLY